jgi:hypothetical protein
MGRKMRTLQISLLVFILPITISAQDYYPLQINNRWDFLEVHFDPNSGTTDSAYSTFQIVSDSVFPNGQQYFVINGYDLTLSGKYVRCDGRFIFYYDTDTNEEDTVFKLGANVGDYWEVMFGPTMHVSVEAIDTVNIFGFQSRIINYELDGLIQYYVTFSDIFGPIDFYWSGEPPGTDYRYKFLVGCMLDSIQYGNPVSVSNEIFATVEDFSLSQNYPNPFNPNTKIKYTIPIPPVSSPLVKGRTKEGFVTLKVYDILGREVATLVNEEEPAGEYEIEFNATILPSGIYFYQIKAGNFVETKKMVLLK